MVPQVDVPEIDILEYVICEPNIMPPCIHKMFLKNKDNNLKKDILCIVKVFHIYVLDFNAIRSILIIN
jgi:hypothetical protein